MNPTAQLRRLVWKDFRTLRPLLLAAVGSSLVFNLVLVGFLRGGEIHNSTFIGWSLAFWIIIPGFVALGGPVMTVGTEQEERTIDWLRTLPIPWQRIAGAKLLSTFAVVAVAWLFATAMLWLMSLGWARSAEFLFHNDPDQYRYGGQSLLGLASVGILLFGYALLVLLGFNLSYLVRFPLGALVTLVPVFFLFMYGSVFLFAFAGAWWLAVLAGIGVLAFLWLTQRLLARKRLFSPAGKAVAQRLAGEIEGPYRPRTSLSLRTRPSQVASLLWQQLRQTAAVCLSLITISVLMVVIFALTRGDDRSRPLLIQVAGGIAPMVIVLSASWLGAIVFYGDNIRMRRRFFSDRGISPTRVWWTRLCLPAACCAVMTVVSAFFAFVFFDDPAWNIDALLQVGVLVVTLFAFGQLVSQWSQRPMLAFLAAPAYAFISLAPVFYLMQRFHGDFASIMLVVPVLLFASWRLTERWLQEEVDAGYTLRLLGYTAAAVLVPCVWIVSGDVLGMAARIIANMTSFGVTA